VEVSAVQREHLADEREFVAPEIQGGSGGQVGGGGGEEPGSMVPDPVAFWELLEEGEEEVEIFADEEGDFLLGRGVVCLGGGGDVGRFEVGALGRGFVMALEFFRENILEDQTSVVPYGVVFWVSRQETGG
jgi:hypothetical protein